MIRRVDALRAGRLHYFTGKPCKRGHVALRYAKGGNCVECWNERYAKQRDQIMQRAVEWNRKNKERRAEICRTHNSNNSDRIREWRKKYHQITKDTRNAYRREWSRSNRDKVNAKHKRWRLRHRDKALAAWARKRHKRRGAVGSFTATDIARIFSEQNGRCAYCRVKLDTVRRNIDHIEPIARGGTNHPSNLQLVCEDCNQAKGAQDPVEFAQSLGRLL